MVYKTIKTDTRKPEEDYYSVISRNHYIVYKNQNYCLCVIYQNAMSIIMKVSKGAKIRIDTIKHHT